jgi:hypothetical protein
MKKRAKKRVSRAPLLERHLAWKERPRLRAETVDLKLRHFGVQAREKTWKVFFRELPYASSYNPRLHDIA